MMSERELNRIELLAQVNDGRPSVQNGANRLDITKRQVLRLLKRYLTGGAAAIRRKARGDTPSNNIHKAERDYAMALLKEDYGDSGPCLAAEILAEHHGFRISRVTLRKWMADDGYGFRAIRTLQDRLVKELRLAGVSFMEDGKAILESFVDRNNASFAKAPAKSKTLMLKDDRKRAEREARAASQGSEI